MRGRDQVRARCGDPIPHHGSAHFYIKFDRCGNHRWRRQSAQPHLSGQHGYPAQRNTGDGLLARFSSGPQRRGIGFATGCRTLRSASGSRLRNSARLRVRRSRYPPLLGVGIFAERLTVLLLSRIRRCRVCALSNPPIASVVAAGRCAVTVRRLDNARRVAGWARRSERKAGVVPGSRARGARGGPGRRFATPVRRCSGLCSSRYVVRATKAVGGRPCGVRRSPRDRPVDVLRDEANVADPAGGEAKGVSWVVELGQGQADLVALHGRREAAAHQLFGDGTSERGRGRGHRGQQRPPRCGQARQFGPRHPGIEPSAFAHPAIVWRDRGDRSSLCPEPRYGEEGRGHANRPVGRPCPSGYASSCHRQMPGWLARAVS